MEYDAVFWDVGGVVLDIDSITEAQSEFIRRAIERYELPMAETDASERWRNAMRAHFAGREGREYRTAREARRKAAEALFDGSPPADWQELFGEVRDERLRLNPGVEETMAALHDAGVYQAIVSDADEALKTELERFGLDRYLDDVTTSEAVGYVKPDPRIFEAALRKAREAGIDPDRGIMVGDKYENDMEGASNAGLATASFGASDGPAVDYVLSEIGELRSIVGVVED